ncbi:MAG: pyridoxamine 5'-phosphate oxidase family protein [bacterium]|nr:pyridoxamine 5'-phosphate oxidase family protein [bacterium]
MHNPIQAFKTHWNQARTENDPNTNFCTLTTVSETGDPSARILVLREVTEDAFSVFISGTSPKWDHLHQSPTAELLTFWPTLMIQYRVRGTVGEIAAEDLKQNWLKKPYASKLLDHYYEKFHAQSSIISSREELLQGIEQLKQEYPEAEQIPFPESAKGICLKATHIEAWQESPGDRLHERYLYTLKESQWSQQVLVP